MAKALHDSFGIEVGTMTTIHAYTALSHWWMARVVKIYAASLCSGRKYHSPHYGGGKSHWSGDPRTERQTERSCTTRTRENRFGD